MKGVDEMKFQLIIDEESDELITARVKKPNELTAKIETLVKEYAGESKIVGFAEDETIILELQEIECVTVIDNKIWAISFFTRNVPGGDQTVYLNDKGITLLIIYGE